MRQTDAAKELLRRKQIRTSLEAWCEHALEPLGQRPARHHLPLIDKLEQIARGEIDRLMVFMPPGSAKSTYVSKLFPAWYFAQHSNRNVIGASYNAELAETFSGDVQRYVQEHAITLGYELETTNRTLWRVSNGGTYRAAGAGGGVTGRRADCILIDDPVKGRAEADSLKIRDTIWNWFRADLYTRLKPGGSIVLVMTRWHEDDLAGRLLKDMQEGGDKWEIVNLPALAEAMDPLGREPGEPLWPQWEDAGALARKRRAVGEREWSALYQQRPTSDEGSILKRDWWLPWTDPVPRNPDMVLISIDTAFTEKDENDPSGCTVWNIVADPANIFRSKILLRYAWRERLTFPDLVSHLIDTATHFRIPGVPLRVLVEAKGPGLSVIQELRRRVPDLGVYQYVPKSDKVARAHSVTAMLEGGHVFGLARMEGEPPKSVFRPTVQMVIDESASFPVGFHDDLTDTVTQALRHIRDLGVELFSEDEPPADDYTQTEALY